MCCTYLCTKKWALLSLILQCVFLFLQLFYHGENQCNSSYEARLFGSHCNTQAPTLLLSVVQVTALSRTPWLLAPAFSPSSAASVRSSSSSSRSVSLPRPVPLPHSLLGKLSSVSLCTSHPSLQHNSVPMEQNRHPFIAHDLSYLLLHLPLTRVCLRFLPFVLPNASVRHSVLSWAFSCECVYCQCTFNAPASILVRVCCLLLLLSTIILSSRMCCSQEHHVIALQFFSHNSVLRLCSLGHCCPIHVFYSTFARCRLAFLSDTLFPCFTPIGIDLHICLLL